MVSVVLWRFIFFFNFFNIFLNLLFYLFSLIVSLLLLGDGLQFEGNKGSVLRLWGASIFTIDRTAAEAGEGGSD